MPSFRVAGLCLVICLLAAPAAGQEPPRPGAFVNVNVAMQDGPQRLAVSVPVRLFVAIPGTSGVEGPGTIVVDDRLDGSVLMDISGGWRGRRYAIGVGYYRTKVEQSHEFTASLVPGGSGYFLFTENGVTRPMEHSEAVVSLDLGLVRQVTDRFDLMVTAGPAFFNVTQDLPTGLGSGSRSNIVETRAFDESAIGLQGALNLNYMFHPRLGIGALLRYARASIDLPDSTESMTLGGFYFGAGARLRF